MARKRIVFIIVEGPSDDEALALMLEKLYDKNKVYVYITHGDITTAPGVNSSNILSKVSKAVDSYAKSTHLSKANFQEIVHILDMDGAYIPGSAVKDDPSAKKTIYSLSEIITSNVAGVLTRNKTKAECIDRLSAVKTLWGIPYQAYYMSCNLDHVLYNKQNSSDEEKEKDSLAFAKKYKNNFCGFVKFICESEFSVDGSYIESWAFIKQDLHSLERHTNLGICFMNNMVPISEEVNES